jgi:cold shock CspA family protein
VCAAARTAESALWVGTPDEPSACCAPVADGFIALEDEEVDVFVHQTDIYAPGFRSLAEGEPLEFRVQTDSKTGKMKAVDVTGPDGAYVQGAPRDPGYGDEY